MSLRSTIAILLVVSILMPPRGLAAPSTDAPNATLRTANYFLRAGFELDASRDTLATYDLVVLPAEAQVYNAETLKDLRRQNPDIILLAYVPTTSWNSIWYDDLHAKLQEQITDEMWLMRDGKPVSIWSGTTVLDLTGSWSDILAEFTASEVYGSGLWDGIMYDEVSDHIGWDLERSDAWHAGYANLFAKTRLLAPNAIILSNGSSSDFATASTDGRIFESFPTPWESNGDWTAQIKLLLATNRIDIVNVNTENTGVLSPSDLRLGLAAALITDCYFSLDYGTASHGQLWSAPDFDGDIGKAQGETIEMQNGLWIRHFTDGVVIANPTSQPAILDNGTLITSIPAHDAVIIDRS